MILTDANKNSWERRWFVLKRYFLFSDHRSKTFANTVSRPYLNVYAHSDVNEETAVIGLTGVNVECNPEMEALLGVCSTIRAADPMRETARVAISTMEPMTCK